MSLNQAITVFKRALNIQKTLGTRPAAGYLRNRGVPIEAALLNLGFPVRKWGAA